MGMMMFWKMQDRGNIGILPGPEFCIPETKNKSSRPLSSSLCFLPLANSSPDRADLVACVRARYSPPSNSRSVSYDPSSLLLFVIAFS
ncbi:hypothetical protein DY000_02000033 [Brassica cretica]|uniref:Uncharacterized protein n=1 Tax=Brassica cretica TaxID=69181 RepID=A0ABQ7BUW4_BRACR|nr:hypothetical protein DY000_02000033 [Brassica cretica]